MKYLKIKKVGGGGGVGQLSNLKGEGGLVKKVGVFTVLHNSKYFVQDGRCLLFLRIHCKYEWQP